MQADTGASRPVSWRERANVQTKTGQATAKTAETPKSVDENAPQGTAKTAEMVAEVQKSSASISGRGVCWVNGCHEEATDRHGIYCADHRRMADDGSLWLPCVFGNGHAPVAPGDLIACATHRAEIDREMAALVARTDHVCQEHPADACEQLEGAA